MCNWTGRLALRVAVLLVGTLALVHRAETCGDPGDPFDDYSIHPDVPLARFFQGNLGILKPTFARSYLVLAYRYLSGVPLTEDERAAAHALWQVRGIDPTHIYPEHFSGGGGEEDRNNPYLQAAQDLSDGSNDWINVRGQVVSSPAPHITRMQGGFGFREARRRGWTSARCHRCIR